MKKKLFALAMAAAIPFSAAIPSSAGAQVTVGIITGATGPGASLGIPYKNTFEVVPRTMGGETVRYVILDDATDTTNAVRLARRLIQEDKVDLIIGSSSVPTTIAVSEVANELKTPQISLSPLPVKPEDNPWAFSVPQPINIMMGSQVEHMQKDGIKTVGFLGFADSWGELVLTGLKNTTKDAGIEIVAEERYGRIDTSVSGQVLKLIAAKPDAVVLGGSGTPGALPQVALRERGYKGPIYHNHGVINRDFLRVGGAALEGAYAPTGPVMVAEQLPDSNPIKKVALEFTQAYEGKFGEGSRNAFAAYSWDAYLLADNAIKTALESAKPGTPEFRTAVRDALENSEEIVGTHGVYNMSPTDHTGVDQRASALVQVEKGDWKLVE
ncbi:ABC transporter substrate-binding protein [Pusillimonas sp.]|uniref:ABC transporter substrate-binding protein n=1 Tax=Pusillimonas sp. TaxID=3040095 RepID=UPI0037CB349D